LTYLLEGLSIEWKEIIHLKRINIAFHWLNCNLRIQRTFRQ